MKPLSTHLIRLGNGTGWGRILSGAPQVDGGIGPSDSSVLGPDTLYKKKGCGMSYKVKKWRVRSRPWLVKQVQGWKGMRSWTNQFVQTVTDLVRMTSAVSYWSDILIRGVNVHDLMIRLVDKEEDKITVEMHKRAQYLLMLSKLWDLVEMRKILSWQD